MWATTIAQTAGDVRMDFQGMLLCCVEGIDGNEVTGEETDDGAWQLWESSQWSCIPVIGIITMMVQIVMR